ncbi:sterol desaturase family protein [Streptomyces tagetis]|uniref:Sterol desaturase family protein n=1 Tax=Streptomyces tagetis TaxID=2820809 RepID=A0A940XE36_9ACTN|nr:sterol desaturase family protein [Streptomyces sp. RG38]MBQ0826561.1 sterol desaturase family protein [Streptomyces sp. RG38]
MTTSAPNPSGSKGAVRRGNAPAEFSSRLLDNVVHVHPLTTTLMFGPVVAVCVYFALGRAGGWALLGWAAAGYLAWTLSEYWGHRVVLHWEPEQGFGARLHWLLHGVHHEYPQDARRSILSPILSVPMVGGAVYLSSGLGSLPLTFGAGYTVGYLSYDLFHLYLHHARPKNRLLRHLRELHMRHHFRDDTRGFGISAPYWDELFGTSIARRQGNSPT